MHCKFLKPQSEQEATSLWHSLQKCQRTQLLITSVLQVLWKCSVNLDCRSILQGKICTRCGSFPTSLHAMLLPALNRIIYKYELQHTQKFGKNKQKLTFQYNPSYFCCPGLGLFSFFKRRRNPHPHSKCHPAAPGGRCLGSVKGKGRELTKMIPT